MSGSGELQGRSAIVTGASRGIGLAIADALTREGASVVMTGRDPKAGEAAAQGLRERGANVRFVRADQGSDADWPAVVAAAEEGPGRFDILVLNGGTSSFNPIATTSLEQFRETTRVHLKGVFFGLKHGVEAFRRHGQGAAVAMVSSIVGQVGVAGFPGYAAAKSGVRLLAKAAALELGPEQIRVNSVHPGMIRTDMTAGFDEAAFAAAIPLGRFGEPGEVAQMVRYLVSDRGRFVTGAEMVVDGGWTTR